MSQCLFVGVRFTSILGNKKYGAEKPTESRRSDLLSSQIPSLSPAWVNPKECNLCTKFRVQNKGERYKSYKITTYTAEITIQAATKDKNEKFYNEIKDLNLTVKEFKFHKHCYHQYTNEYVYRSRSNKANADKDIATEKASSYDAGKLEEIKKFVIDEVIGLGRAISLKVLHIQIYGIAVGDDRYHNKLKNEAEKSFKRTNII